MTAQADPSWASTVAFLTSLTVPAAVHVGRLMESAQGRWDGRLVLRSSMHDALLTRPNASYPFADFLTVSWSDETFTFRLFLRGELVSGDHCHATRSADVLDAFAVQLAGGDL
jgi:hypothetical protein